MRHPIGQTNDGKDVYVELIGSEAGRQIAQQPQLLLFAQEMLSRIAAPVRTMSVEHDMKRPIGYSTVVSTTEQDSIFYGQLLKDDVFTRFVKNGKPESTRHLSIQLLKDGDGSYELVDIWVGRLRPARPGSPVETAESKRFWADHAVMYSDQRLQVRTVTKTCPY